MTTCLFCSFASGEAFCHRVWEDERHLAFLTIFPNTPGFTVVIPKAHRPSYAFDLSDNEFTELVLAARIVGKLIDRAFEDVGRTAMVFEGFGVDHVHAKLIPLHGTRMEEWRPMLSGNAVFSQVYQGFIDTRDGPRADDHALTEVAERIRNA